MTARARRPLGPQARGTAFGLCAAALFGLADPCAGSTPPPLLLTLKLASTSMPPD